MAQPADTTATPAATMPASGSVDVPGDRAIARVLRWVRIVTIGMLVLLGATIWQDAWPVRGVAVGPAVAVVAAWLLATNAWSLRQDHRPRPDVATDVGTTVEVGSDVALALAMTVLGGPVVADTLPLLGVLVVIEASVRLRRRPAAAVTAGYVLVSVLAITLRWPAWVGWTGRDLLVDLLPAVIALPTAHLLVAHLATDRAETRDVALGQARRLALVARDLRAANTRLATSNEELTAFAGRIAHDLRSPLGTVVTALETLQRPELELDDDTREFLVQQSLRAATRSVATVGALLDHASAEGRAPTVALVDVGEVAAEVVATLPAETLGTVDVDLPRGPALAWADPQLLPLVLQNLVTNALTHGGSRVGRIAVATESTEDGVVVTVADDGPGIPEHVRTEVFTAGTGQGDTRGLGLGLATCHSIVHRHGGRIWVDDSALGGAAVSFVLPWPDGERPSGTTRGRGTARAGRLVDLADGTADQRTRATSSSSGSSRATSPASYRPGSAPATLRTSSPASSTRRTSPGTV